MDRIMKFIDDHNHGLTYIYGALVGYVIGKGWI